MYRDILDKDFTAIHEKAAAALNIQMGKFLYEFPVHLILDVVKTKLYYIASASTKKEMDQILEISRSRYEGSRWIPQSPYHIEKEELLFLATCGLMAPLTSEAVDRMFELTKRHMDLPADVLNELE